MLRNIRPDMSFMYSYIWKMVLRKVCSQDNFNKIAMIVGRRYHTCEVESLVQQVSDFIFRVIG